MIPDDVKERLKKKYNLEEPTPFNSEQRLPPPRNRTEYPATTEFHIDPYKGAGELLLGMTPDEVQAALNFQPRAGRRFHYGTDTCDKMDDYRCCFVYFKNDTNKCHFVEFYSERISVMFHGKNLMNIPYEEAETFVRQYDPDIQTNGTGFVSLALGFGVYAEFAFENTSLPVETVCVFEKGYFAKNNK